jgi:hypothetical protein
MSGTFSEFVNQETAPPDYAEIRKLFDPEEIKRRKERSQGKLGRTLDQIMDRLGSMENDRFNRK